MFGCSQVAQCVHVYKANFYFFLLNGFLDFMEKYELEEDSG